MTDLDDLRAELDEFAQPKKKKTTQREKSGCEKSGLSLVLKRFSVLLSSRCGWVC